MPSLQTVITSLALISYFASTTNAWSPPSGNWPQGQQPNYVQNQYIPKQNAVPSSSTAAPATFTPVVDLTEDDTLTNTTSTGTGTGTGTTTKLKVNTGSTKNTVTTGTTNTTDTEDTVATTGTTGTNTTTTSGTGTGTGTGNGGAGCINFQFNAPSNIAYRGDGAYATVVGTGTGSFSACLTGNSAIFFAGSQAGTNSAATKVEPNIGPNTGISVLDVSIIDGLSVEIQCGVPGSITAQKNPGGPIGSFKGSCPFALTTDGNCPNQGSHNNAANAFFANGNTGREYWYQDNVSDQAQWHTTDGPGTKTITCTVGGMVFGGKKKRAATLDEVLEGEARDAIIVAREAEAMASDEVEQEVLIPRREAEAKARMLGHVRRMHGHHKGSVV